LYQYSRLCIVYSRDHKLIFMEGHFKNLEIFWRLSKFHPLHYMTYFIIGFYYFPLLVCGTGKICLRVAIRCDDSPGAQVQTNIGIHRNVSTKCAAVKICWFFGHFKNRQFHAYFWTLYVEQIGIGTLFIYAYNRIHLRSIIIILNCGNLTAWQQAKSYFTIVSKIIGTFIILILSTYIYLFFYKTISINLILSES